MLFFCTCLFAAVGVAFVGRWSWHQKKPLGIAALAVYGGALVYEAGPDVQFLLGALVAVVLGAAGAALAIKQIIARPWLSATAICALVLALARAWLRKT